MLVYTTTIPYVASTQAIWIERRGGGGNQGIRFEGGLNIKGGIPYKPV